MSSYLLFLLSLDLLLLVFLMFLLSLLLLFLFLNERCDIGIGILITHVVDDGLVGARSRQAWLTLAIIKY